VYTIRNAGRYLTSAVIRVKHPGVALAVFCGSMFVGSTSVLTQSAVCSVVTDTLLKTAPTVVKPGYLLSYIDPTFGSTVTRITGDPGTAIPSIGGTWGEITRHNYSKDPVWNADQKLMVLKGVQGVAGMLFIDGTTYNPLFVRSGPGGETRWHPLQADVMVYLTNSCEFGSWNVRTNLRTPVLTAAGYTDCYMGPWEGNTSSDGRWIAAYALRNADSKRVAFAVDLVAAQKYADLDLAAQGVTDTDWVSVSATGAYLVVNGTIAGCTTVGGFCDATKVFTRAGVLVGSWSDYGRPSHFDLTLDVAGNEVAVGVAKSSPYEGKVIMRRLTDGVVTALTVGGYASHTSARNTQRGGWAYVSHSYDGPNWLPFRNEVFAVKLDSSLSMERLAHLHATTPTYEAQPQGTPSPDGKRVVFASNWSSAAGGPIQAYVTAIRPPCLAAPVVPTNFRVVS
jgi:hypothetical protein